LQVLGVALSFWNPRGKSNDTFLDVIESTFPKKALDSKIRRDVSVSESSVFGKPVFETAPKSRAAQDYLALTKEILTRM
jgi:chromosome partitioning protein